MPLCCYFLFSAAEVNKMGGIFFRKSMLHLRCPLSVASSSTHNVFLIQNYLPMLFSLKYTSTNTKTNEHSFIVSYLINSCGLAPKSALLASKQLNFKTPDKPDKVVNFLKDHGFSKSQIAKLVRGNPNLLCYANPGKIFLPKIEFFYSKGMSSTGLWKLSSYNPKVWASSLKGHIILYFDFMKSLLGSDNKVILVIKRCPRMINYDYHSCVVPNIGILEQYGVSYSNIMYLLFYHPGTLVLKPNRFKQVVEKVKLMGLDPFRFSFVIAVDVMCSLNESTLESKHNALKRWGLSEKEIFSAFVRFPRIMSYSKDKIMAAMNFFVNEMAWESSHVIGYPELIGMSLKKRLIPRCSVIKVLLSKGLISRATSLNAMFYCSEKIFLKKFVIRYEEEAPHLLNLYKERLELSK